MAEYVNSEYRVTWDPDGASPLVLLDFDERMLADLELPQQWHVQKKKHYRADSVKMWGRGGVSGYLNYSVVKDYDTAEEARNAMFREQIIFAALRDAALQLEVRNGATFQWDEAAMEAANPRVYQNQVHWNFDIPCSGLTEPGVS